jgi:hypothetical protein
MLYDADFGFGLNFFYVPGRDEFAQHDTLAFAASPVQTAQRQPPRCHADVPAFLSNAEPSGGPSSPASAISSIPPIPARTSPTAGRSGSPLVAPEMDEHAARWRQPTNWTYECDRIRAYGEQRTDAVWGHVRTISALPRRST